MAVACLIADRGLCRCRGDQRIESERWTMVHIPGATMIRIHRIDEPAGFTVQSLWQPQRIIRH